MFLLKPNCHAEAQSIYFEILRYARNDKKSITPLVPADLNNENYPSPK